MKRVMIVDDHEANRYLLRALLQGHGYIVEEARHGAEALAGAQRNAPELIISDLMMPVMDGFMLLRQWKADERLKGIPFVVYTATYTEPKDERLTLALGADAFIIKPAEPEPFIACIQDVLSKAQRGELQPASERTIEEPALFQAYDEVLFHKLEQKAMQLEQTNRELLEEIAERKRTEAALRHAKEATEKANRAKSEFLATISHELRTPLSIILGYTSILLEEGDAYPAPDRLAALHRIDRSAHELYDLITAVLDMRRLEAGRLPLEITSVSVPDLLMDLQRDTLALQEHSGLIFVWRVDEPLPLLQTDAGKLKIVLKNLLDNAIKFTKQGTVTIRARSQENGIEIGVQDNGSGIAPEALEQIFEPFYQVDEATRLPGGTGLGLSIVQRLVVLLGGRIRVESAVGSGSVFRVWVPVEIPEG
jgi:signal transduction histidine kinase